MRGYDWVIGAWRLLLSLGLVLFAVEAEFFTPEDVPGPPEKILVSPASDSSIRVQFLPPLNVKPEGVNGAPVLGYKVEVARRVDEVQTFSVAATGPILAGGYKLIFKNDLGTETTSCISWDASEVEFEMALEELPNVDSVGVSRSAYSATKNGYVYTVTFDGAYLVSGAQTNLLKGDTTGCQAVQPPNRMLSFEPARVTAGVSGFYPEVWEIVSTDTSNAQVLGGTFDLSVGFEGEWVYTNPVVRATIAAGSRTATTDKPMLGVVNRGDRVRIHGEVFKVHLTAPFTDKVLPLDSYHVHGVSAVGGVAIEVMDTALGNVQVENGQTAVTTSGDFSGRIGTGDQIRIGSHYVEVGAVVSGTVTLKSGWTGGTALHVTAFARKKTTLRASAEAAEMKRALSSLPGVGSVDVSRVGPTNSNGYRWYITFQSLDNVNLRVDKKIGTSYFIDVYGDTCTNCKITASIVQDDTQATTFREIKGDYAASAVVATQEVGGVIAEVQTISTKASADDISGSFTISFQFVGGAVINFDDTAADVRTKLQSLSTIGRLNVIRTANTDFGATWTITFLSNLGDLRLLSVDDQTLLKGTGVNVVVQEVVKGVDVDFETIIEGLDPGQDYYVRAFARNENGYGTSTTDLQQRGRGALPLLTTVATSPDPPGINGMWPLSGSQMELRLSTPVDHGDPISKYVLEYAVGDTFGTVGTKKLFIYSSIENDITGTFRLQYGDDISTMLSVHTTASSLRSALNSLPSIRPVSVTRGLYVVIDGPGVSFSVANKRVITTALTATQCKMLEKGVRIEVGNKRFTVRVQPVEGATAIDVEPGDGVVGLGNVGVVKIDDSGNQRGPYGYQWTISFDNDVGDIAGLQVTSLLTSVSTGTGLPVKCSGIKVGEAAVPPAHYGYFEINNDENVCDTYVVGAPSAVQVVRLFAPTTVTAGTFQLKLGSETTGCITLGKLGTPSTMKKLLENLNLVSKVTVEEVRAFKVSVLFGSAKSKVTDYSNGILTIVSTDTSVQPNDGLTADQVTILLKDSIIQVSRNPNDFTRHSCEFVIGATPSVGAKQISATAVGSCSAFQNEARALKILDFHDYNVRFWGHYPTGEWPTLQFDPIAFGTGTGTGSCAAWAPSGLKIYGQIHSVKYEGVCSKGQAGIQTILADGSSTIGGTFTLSYLGKVTSPLSFRDTGAAEMRDAIDLITASGTVDVSVSQYGTYGKAWHVTFMQIGDDDQDAIFIQHSRLTGQNALISVYPTVTVFTDAKRDDIRGSFRLTINGETTEPIGYSATHMKVAQELQKLSVVDSVIALGAVSAGDIGVYALELKADATGSSLLNVKLDGSTIDPTKFLAVGDTLKVGSSLSTTIQSLTPDVITMVDSVGSTSTLNADIYVGQITKQTKPLPGFVGISPLMRVLAVTKGLKKFQLPADHGLNSAPPNNVFYIAGTTFTVASVSGMEVTTNQVYQGESVVGGYPKVYLFDNVLHTTETLLNLVEVGDHLWLPSVSADMNKYQVSAITERSISVIGSITDTVTRMRAYHISNGRRWSLVFRSYDGVLDSVDAFPEHDWRGTEARIGTRSPKAVAPNVINVGNPASTQTVRLKVTNTGVATTYTLSFANEAVLNPGTRTTRDIPWDTINANLKAALESLDSVDGVTVVSIVRGGIVIHTISFWGTYPMKKLPLLVVTPATNNLNAYIWGNDAVAETKQGNLILENSQNYAFRIFAENSKGVSDAVSVFQAQTAASSVIPTPPTGVALGEYHGPTWLSINYWAPLYSGGARVTMYRIEWDSTPIFNGSSIDYGVASIQEKIEVQQVTTIYRSSVGAGGTFTLSWGGHITSALPFDCSVATMTDALAFITDTLDIAVDPVKITRARVSWGYTWKITFLHNPGDLALLVADGTQLTGDFPRIRVTEVVQGFADLAIADFTHEVQEVYTDGVSAVGGYFTLIFNGKTTGGIQFDASALEMQAALQTTTTSYSIKVTKAPRNTAINTAIWSVTFAYLRGEEMVGAGNIFTMTADSYLTGTSAVVQVTNKVVGSDPFRFSITSLRPGVRYYAHVMAYNADGFGSATSPLSSAVTCGQPQPPQSVVGTVVDGTTLSVSWEESGVAGNLCSVDKYKVEWYRQEGIQEQQTITTSAGKGLPDIQRLMNFADSRTLSGFFKLSFGGERTENLLWNAEAIGQNSVKERLERLSTIGTVDVTRKESTRVTGLFVTVSGKTVTRHSLSTSSVADTKLAKDDTIWIAGNKRTIMTPVAAGDTTLTIDTDLEVTVPVPVFKSAYGYVWEITFLAGHVGPQELIQVAPSDSWTGNNPGILVDSIQKGLQPISGTFQVAFSSGGLSDSTPPLPHNISSFDMQAALESLITIGTVNVTRSANGYGYNWVVTFLSESKNDLSLLSVDGTALQGPGARVLSAQTFSGTQPAFYCEKNGLAGSAAEITVPGKLRYAIQGLKTGQKYAIRVRAHNGEGYGNAASISPAFQIPRTTPSAPLNVELLVLSSKSIKLRWSAPSNDGGTAILGYRIQWDTANTFPNVNTPNYDYQTMVNVSTADTGTYFYNINTPVLMTYYVRILAFNDQGDGSYVTPVPNYARPIDRTPGRPEDAIATALSSYAILVEWKSSSVDKFYYGGDGGLPITQYMVEWDTSPAFDSPAAFGLVDGTKRSFIIGGDDAITGVRSDILVAGSSYNIRVTAFNAKGSGPPRRTVPSSVVVTNQPPSAPQGLTLSVASATSVKAEWSNPLFDGGSSLKSYRLEWDEQEDFASGQTSTATIPIVREMQSVAIESDVVNEEQFVDVTVEVVNEEQEVRSTFAGIDEVQVIKTTNDVVKDEVQQIVTTANDLDEIQALTLTDDDIDEIQAIRTAVTESFEVQTINVGVTRVFEVQTLSITLTGTAGDVTKVDSSPSASTFYLTFDSTGCTYCLETMKYSATTDTLIPSLTDTDNTRAAAFVETKLEDLNNIDDVKVTRDTTSTGTADIAYTYSITFKGNDVGGDVPLLTTSGTIIVNNAAITIGIPPTTSQITQGNEPIYSSTVSTNSVFSVTYTCESYSNPKEDTTFSDACVPTTQVCALCVTTFDGSTFTLAAGTSVQLTKGMKLMVGVCSFEVATFSPNEITIATDDPGALCSKFSGVTLSLYMAPQRAISNVPVKQSATEALSASDVQNMLKDVIDGVTTQRNFIVTPAFVGAAYSVTFTKQSGKIPMLECDASGIVPIVPGSTGTPVCSVTRTAPGSMLTGTFKVGLISQDDTDPTNAGASYTTPTAYSAAIPWDATGLEMKTLLEAVDTQTGKLIFGTVSVSRTPYYATGNKWSGGFTWEITFTSRGWDIPIIKVDGAGLKSSVTNSNTGTQVSAGDKTTCFTNPVAACRDENQVGGTITFTFRGVTDTCTIGIDTSLADLRGNPIGSDVPDTQLRNFFVNKLKIPTITVTRSPASQARGFTWSITFIDDSTGGDVEDLSFVTALVSNSNNGRTSLAEPRKGNQLAGSFQLEFNGESTGPILAGAEASDMQSQLNSLRTIKPSSVTVSRSLTNAQVKGYTWLITFHSSIWVDPTRDHSQGIDGNWKGAAAAWGDVWESGYSKAWGRQVGPTSLLVCNKNSLVTTDGTQKCDPSQVSPGVAPIGGSFSIKFDTSQSPHLAVKSQETSDPIAHDAFATKEESGFTGTSVEEILEKMTNIGDVEVSRNTVNMATGGYEWTVTFQRDANDPQHQRPCEQLETLVDGTTVCNSPGNVPQMTTVETSLKGSNPHAEVTTSDEGAILRGDFTDFKVQGDAGVAQRYKVSVTCSNAAGTPCTVTTFTIRSGASTIRNSLLAGDRFIVDGLTACVFEVVDVDTGLTTPTKITVKSLACGALNVDNTASSSGLLSLGLSILIPWNGEENLVKRVLEAAATEAGRKVSVKKSVHGKYGDISWLVHFISNPTYTPLGAGDLPPIDTTFKPETILITNPISVAEITPGSDGLSGSFLLDFHSSFGPRDMAFNEDPVRMERKLNEMDTIGRVSVERFEYPSEATGCTDTLCSGGWDNLPVGNTGTRGGYRWRIRFLRVTGEYEGFTFPPGSGNLDEFLVDYLTSLKGNGAAVVAYTNTAGSSPILGTFKLSTPTAQTPALLYSASAETLKQGIEAMDLFGEVDVTQSYLLTQKIPGVTADIARDSGTATVRGVGDIRQYLSPTDVVRFGSSSADNFVGSNGDAPFTGSRETSIVTVSALSPIVVASTTSATKLLYPGVQLRIDGLPYDVQRSGHEIQSILVSIPSSSSQSDTFYSLKLSRAGITYGSTACFALSASSDNVQSELLQLVRGINPQAPSDSVQVSRSSPVTTATMTGYIYSVYFFGDAVAGDVAKLQKASSDPTGTPCTGVTDGTVTINVVAHGGNLPHQRLSLATDSGQVIDSNGYFKMSLDGEETDCILWGASASDVENAVESKLKTGNVIVTRQGGGISQTEIQRLRMTADAEVTTGSIGFFRLQFTYAGKTAATNSISYGVSATKLQTELNSLSNLGFTVDHINVTRDGDGSSTWGFGYEYLINFRGPSSGGYSPVVGDVPLLEIVNLGQSSTATGGHPALIIETVREGSSGYIYDIFFLDYTKSATIPTMGLRHEGQGVTSTCTTGWIQNGGSVRGALIESVDSGGSSEIQILTVYNKDAFGTFLLTFQGQTTRCLPFSSDASALQNELNLLTTIDVDGVSVSRDTDMNKVPNGYIYRITFVGDLVTGNVPLLIVQEASTTCTNVQVTTKAMVTLGVDGGQSSGAFALTSYYNGEAPGVPHVAYTISQQFSVMSEQFEVQKLEISNPSSTGATYKLTIKSQLTSAIPWDASESVLETALAATGTVTTGDVTATRRLVSNGFVYIIYFSGASVTGNLDPLVPGSLSGLSTGDVLVSTIRDGVGGAPPFTKNTIPLASLADATVASAYRATATSLDVFKVNGLLWTVKFKSSLGNIPKLGKQTDALSAGTLTVTDNFIPGSASNSYVIPNLVAGIIYYVHVAAMTDIGTGQFSALGSIMPSGTASAVQNIDAGYALYETEIQEIRLAASHITEVQEITTEAARIAEVQTLRTYASPLLCPIGPCIKGSFAFRVPTVQTVTISADAAITSGTFTLLFTREVEDTANRGSFKNIGVTTASIVWNADANTVQSALLSAANIASGALVTGDIVVTRDGDSSADFGYGYVFQITFVGNNVAGETKKIVCTKSFVPTTSSCVVTMETDIAMGTDTAIQQVIVTADKPLVAGSYSLLFRHLSAQKSSSCIPFDASDSIMDITLEAMDNIDKVYVTRERNYTVAPNGFIYQIFFHGNGVYGTVELLDFVKCTDFQTQEKNVLTTVGVNGKVLISMVDYGGFDPLNTFVTAVSATADQLTTDLKQLPVFGDVLVSQSLVDQQGGYIWTVAFKDSDGNLPQFICGVDTVFKTGAGAACETDTLTDGNVLSGSLLIEASPPIPFDADAGTMKTVLESMSWVGTVQVKQSAPSPQLGYTWTITFLDYRGDVPTLLVTSSLVGMGSQVSVSEVRKGNALGGNFTLTYGSSVTTAIDWDAPAMAVIKPDGSSLQEKLEALDTIGQVNAERSESDQEGGYTWVVTFLDSKLNLGDLPLLQGNITGLTGEGAVISIKEVTKGSDALGDQLWLSFDPPATDNGSPITRYQVRWDTSDKFNANPADVFISDADILYRTQRITTSAMSLAWSSNMITPVDEVQKLTIKNNPGTFTLSFRGLTTGPLTTGAVGAVVGVSTKVDLETALEALSSVGSVDISSSDTVLTVGAEFLVTFRAQLGDLPLMSPDTANFVSITEHQAGTTNFRKEVVVFKCTATSGTVRFTYKGKNADVNYNAALADVETSLATNFDLEPDSISVSSSPPQTTLCPGSSADISVRFDRVYGDISLTVGPSTVITPNTAASIDGVYNDDPALTMSGTFQVGYQGLYTRPLNAESSADQLRYALEDLDTIQTVGVSRDRSYRPLPGKVDVTQGEIFATCSAGETCNFYSAGYGLPGYVIRIGGDWYTVRTDTSSPGLHSSRLYLGDLSGREVGYLGSTDTAVTVYEWTKGYEWTVDMLSVSSPLGYLRSKIPRIYPLDATVRIVGSSCHKCYYIPSQTSRKLVVGQQYFINVFAYNPDDQGEAPDKSTIATPRKVPDAPSNVDLLVVSGKEIEVFFSPPALALTNMSPDFNKDISSYIVQWDLGSTFKHGLTVCTGCAKALTGIMLTVTVDLTGLKTEKPKLTVVELGCAVEVVDVLSKTVVQLNGNHDCDNFNTRAYSLTYFTFPPATVKGALIQGSPPFRYLISNLVIGKEYFVRVAAVNSVPVQKIALDGNPPDNHQWSSVLSVITKNRIPDAPLSVALYPYSGTILQLQIQPSTRDGEGKGGGAITAFWVDIDTVSTFDSVGKSNPVEIPVTSDKIPELYPGGPRIYYLTGLTTGTRYFAQVKTVNAQGYSRAKLAPSPVAPTRHSDEPINTKVTTLTVSSTPIDSATVTWQKPNSNGGLGLTNYKIEWWRGVSRPEMQVVELTWITKPTSAKFALFFRGGKSEDLDMNILPENLRSALMNIAVNGQLVMGDVEVSLSTINNGLGYQWAVTFVNTNVNAGNQPLLQLELGTVIGSTDLTGRVFELTSGIAVPALTTFPGKQEVQVLVSYHATATVGGYFRLGYKGSAWTNYLPAAISGPSLKLALEAVPIIGVVNVNLETMVSGGQIFTHGQVWTITFISNVGNLPPLTVEPSKLTPADAFLGVKDGDNAVDGSGILCLPGSDPITCRGSWPPPLGLLKQQYAPQKTIVDLATPGEAAVDYAFYETLSAATLTYTIPGLVPGRAYFIAVTAKNGLGLGIRSQSSPTSVTPPLQVPGPPTSVSVDVNPGVATQLVATWAAPTSDGGSAVRMYRVEFDPSPLFTNRGQQDAWCPVAPTFAVWTVQTVRTSAASATSKIANGYFTLELTRLGVIEVSNSIPWDAVATAREEIGSSAVSSSKVFCTSSSPTCTNNPNFPFGRLEKSGSMQSKVNYFKKIFKGVDVQRSTQAVDGGYTWSITFFDTGNTFSLAARTVKLTCTDPTLCTTAAYDVVVKKIRAEVLPSSCVGSRIVPSTGALNKGQLYYLRVSAYNEVGFGKPGASPNPQKPMVVPGLPTAVTLSVYSVSELVLLFSPPDDNGGDTVTDYEIQYAPIDKDFTNPSSVVVTMKTGMTAPYRRVISSLTKGTPYYFRIRAKNSQGYGHPQASVPPKMQPYTTPSAPTQAALGVTSATMLTVRWAPPSDDGGSSISGYVVQWDIAAGFDSLALTTATTMTVGDPAQRSYTITGLTPGTLYYVRVFAKNIGGMGTPQTTTPSSQVPAVTSPGKPNSLTMVPTLVVGELRITWAPPVIPFHGYPCAGTLQAPESCPVLGSINMVYGGVALARYVIQYSEFDDFRNPIETTTASSVETVLLTGLVSSKTYYVQVLAENAQFLRSFPCKRANTQSLLCPDQQVLLDGTVLTGSFVYAQPL
ncbi:Titin [Phytophthora citrophthora]|uniref:Titin n=1 Tax=Phytophthora citrophthora TaxID=4793 RepID=A0AAD9GP05_9STRA|nr:Titin [Phytophthora citrophthora]